MPDDEIDQQRRTTKGAVEKHKEESGRVRGAVRAMLSKTGAVDNLEDERDDLRDTVKEDNQAFQSYLDQDRDNTDDLGRYAAALYDQILMDRRAFLGGMAVLGAAFADKSNLLPTDGSYDPLPGEEHNSEQPHDDWDAFGMMGEQGFEPHQAAEGAPSNAGYQIVNEDIDREAYEEIFTDIVREDRSMASRIMSPEAFDRYFDGEGTEFYEMNVSYDPDPKRTNSALQVGTVDMDEIASFDQVGEEDISYSGWINVDDDVAQTLVQEVEAYE